ncbi:FAD binding domain-containing protein [Chloroflexota bacterium]
MKLPPFNYLAPHTIEEGCCLKNNYGNEASFMAGGTDLLIKLKANRESYKCVIGLTAIENLDCINEGSGELKIGALATLNKVADSPLIKKKAGCLSYAAEHMATNQVRNLGTIGGNLCNASPSGDIAPPLIVLGAKLKISGVAGTRTIPVEEFIIGPGKNALQQDEILTEIQIPSGVSRQNAYYLKFSSRSARDIAAVGVAVSLTFDDSNCCQDSRIALGAVASTPIRAHKAEDVVIGQIISEALAIEAGKQAGLCCKPISDIRASAEYRKHMVAILVKRALLKLWKELN